MSLHTGSADLAHALNRFSRSAGSGRDHEFIAGEALRLGVGADTVRRYLDCYGEGPVVARTRRGQVILPAYELYICRDITGVVN